MNFSTWLDTFVAEKGLDTEHVFEVPGASGPNVIPLGCVIEAMKFAPAREQAAIKGAVVKIDFANGKVLPFFEHCAKALAV